MSSISAGTTTTTGYVVSSDTTGALVLKTGASGTTALTIDTSQNVTFVGSQTLSGGTANGVAYLNGSKVVTSGSALTFSGSALGVNATSTDASMSIQALTANYASVLSLVANNDNGAQYNNISSSTSGGTVHWRIGGVAGTSQLPFSVGGSEGMRLTSTGLGIGTSSPASKLQVTASSSSGTSGADGARFNAGGNVAINIGAESSSGYGWIQSANWGSGYIATAINPNGGNVGIGTSSPSAKLSVKTTGAQVDISTSATDLVFEAIDRTTTSNPIDTKFYTRNGTFQWYNGQYTERMRLDTSGNLGLGVIPFANSLTSGSFDLANGVGLFGFNNGFNLSANAYYNGGWKYKATAAACLYDQGAGKHNWYVAPSGTAGNAITFNQAMTLTAAGYLGIGTTSPSYKFVISNGGAAGLEIDATGGIGGGGFIQAYNRSTSAYFDFTLYAGNTIFANSGTEKARINSSGTLLVNLTTAYYGEKIGAYSNTSYNYNSIRGGTSSAGHFVFVNDNGAVGTIFTSGTSTSYNTSSDYRLKNSIAPMTGALVKVALLKPVTYKWNADGSDGEGFIAHELAEVVPQCVSGEKDAVETYTDADGNEQTRPKYQGIDVSFLVATLTAAIQEQQALIESLTQRIAALEGQP